ncbi:MAG: diguanylate cyclase [Anaerolineales bacterium]|nr:diguanylate cyclase [Anaerolineales bacterium]
MQNTLVPKQEKRDIKRFLGKLAIIILLTIFYFFAGKLGLSFASVNPNTTAIWAPTGIALAAFLIFGEYIWPAILVGAFLVNYTTSGLIQPSILIAIGNTLEGLVGAYLINQFAGGIHAFERTQNVLKFAILAAIFGPALSATIGVTSLIWSGLAAQSDYLSIWLTWWLGDAAGALIVAPLLIVWAAGPKTSWTSARALEAIFLFLSLILLCLAVFSDLSPFGANNLPLGFTIVPWIIWAAFRFGQRGAATTTIIITVIAIMGTLQGFGPFVRTLPNESLLLLQSFIATITITALVIAALVSERQEIENELRGSNNSLMLSVEELAHHNEKMIKLNEMGDLLQSCSRIEEAYAIIGQMGQQLFKEESGALYMINNSKNVVETTVVWGAHPPEQDLFTLDECWALRRGRVHVMNEGGLELPCPHLKGHSPLAALCIPMTAQGETIGILHLQSTSPVANQTDQKKPVLSDIQRQLAEAMADTVALSLANLKLRTSLFHQSIRDPLTNLFNRRYLEETLEREIHRAARLQRSVAVIMLDIDHFKRFNDMFGHEAGDALLRELGLFLKKQIRGGDFACRYGGEEFTLIFPEVSLKDIRQRTEKLREEIKSLSVQHNGQTLESITLSLGVAMFPDHGTLGKELLQAADTALYEAKHNGRDRVVIAVGTTETEDVSEQSV